MKNLLIVLLFIASLSFLFSCDKTVEKEETSTTGTELITEPEVPLSDCKDVCPDRNPGDYEISKECYDCMTGNYAANEYKYTKYQGNDVKGFQIDGAEIVDILVEMVEYEDFELHGMMGMQVTPESGEGEAKPHLLFVVNTPEGHVYYDFTRPCPDSCPD